ncbi:hypothetical protein ERO13_D10G215450v2 [Gossypium hirsutum]|nr:hypothetical protein ERO13_D10G215450v2 [Gossypium hirsutum]
MEMPNKRYDGLRVVDPYHCHRCCPRCYQYSACHLCFLFFFFFFFFLLFSQFFSFPQHKKNKPTLYKFSSRDEMRWCIWLDIVRKALDHSRHQNCSL